MKPAARYAAAIDVLDLVIGGQPAEKALTTWGRANRFAGSKDRAALRDHVFDVLRQRRSLGALGGGDNGRALVIGLLRQQGIEPDSIFGVGGYAPSALAPDETVANKAGTGAVAADLPDWLWPIWKADLGEDAWPVAQILQTRAPITLRVNTRRGSVQDAITSLAHDGITAIPVSDSKTALQVIENPRRIRNSDAYSQGMVELQDLASQRAVAAINVPRGGTCLDYCAGGGGKALALADMHDLRVFAHDISVARMADIPVRAARAGVDITVLDTASIQHHAPFDLVFCDAPCSGAGTWRRAPEAKLALTKEKLFDYNNLQAEVLSSSAQFVAPKGTVVYATCSVLRSENDVIVDQFLSDNDNWHCVTRNLRLPDACGDGFFYAVLQKRQNNL